MGNSRTPRKASEPLLASLEQALEPWLTPVSPRDSPSAHHQATIAVAFSGGLDSSALLHATCQLLKPLGIPLFAIHVNHGLSPNAAHWAAFCARTSEQLGITFEQVKVTVARQASIEAAAREVRYQALAKSAKAAGATLLLTAHHADDQAETVLLNMLRGTGVLGLRGVAPTQALAGMTLLRPWLSHSRDELEHYAAEHALAWVEDESNQSEAFKRNAIRHQALPVLKSVAPDLLVRLGSLARHAQTDAFLLDELARLDLLQSERGAGLDIEYLRALDMRRAANLLRFWLRTSGFGTPTEATLNEWLDQIGSKRSTIVLEFAAKRFAIESGTLHLVANTSLSSPEARLEFTWKGEATLVMPTWRGQLHFEAVNDAGVSAERLRTATLSLRTRGGGERLQLSTHAPSRTLKNLYQEAGIGSSERSTLPLMYCGDDLVFAAGLGMNLRQCNAEAKGIRLRWVPNA